MKQHEISIPFCDKCALETASLFRHLTRDEVDKVNFEKEFRSFHRGELLYSEGSRISGFYCIHSGIIKVFKTGLDGKNRSSVLPSPGISLLIEAFLAMKLHVLQPGLLRIARFALFHRKYLYHLLKAILYTPWSCLSWLARNLEKPIHL